MLYDVVLGPMLREITMITANRNRGKVVFENYSIRRGRNMRKGAGVGHTKSMTIFKLGSVPGPTHVKFACEIVCRPNVCLR